MNTRGIGRTIGVGLLAAWLGAAPAAMAATDWYVATNGNGTAGTAWDTAFTNVQDALNAATDNDTIYLAGHTFGITNQLVWSSNSYVTIRGGYAATNTADQPGPRDSALWPTVLVRSGTANHRILDLSSANNSVLDGVTVTGGNVYDGAGIRIAGSTNVLLAGCTIVSNTFSVAAGAARNGAGLYATGSEVTLSNCLVRMNAGINNIGHGGAFARGGGIWSDGLLAVIDSRIVGNLAAKDGPGGSGQGGGIYFAGTRLALRNVLLAGNSTMRPAPDRATTLVGVPLTGAGAGLYAAAGTVGLTNVSVVHNGGEGIFRAGGTVGVTDSVVWGNWVDVTGTVTVAYSLVGDTDWGDNQTGDPGYEYGYYLAPGSVCLGAGSDTAGARGLAAYTTGTNGAAYAVPGDTVDLGYHHPPGAAFDLTWADLYVSEADGDDANDGLTAGAPFRTLTKALAAARDGTRIHVAAGEYARAEGATPGETFPLALADRVGVRILGAGAADTVITATGSGARVMEWTGAHRTVLEGITLAGGETYFGGGLSVHNSQGVSLSGCAVVSNRFSLAASTQRDGPGLYLTQSSASLSNVVIRANVGLNIINHGSAYARGGGVFSDGILAVRDSRILDNLAALDGAGTPGTGQGGGVFSIGPRLALDNVLLAGNSTLRPKPERNQETGVQMLGAGHGLFVGDGAATLKNVTVAENAGEGIRRVGGTVSVTDSVVWGNWKDIVGAVAVDYSLVGDEDYGGNNQTGEPDYEYGYYLAPGSVCLGAGSDTAGARGLAAYTTGTNGAAYAVPGDTVDLGYHHPPGAAFDLTWADLYVSEADGDDANDGLTAGAPFRTLTKALAAARDGTRIHVAAGEYARAEGATPGETFPLALADRVGVRILGAGAADTVITAAGSGARVMEWTGAHRTVLEGVTLTDGGTYYGGGLQINSSQGVRLNGCVIANNRFAVANITPRTGAGIHAASSDLTLDRCIIRDNSGTNSTSHSLAIARGGGLWSDGVLTVLDTVLADNTASSLPASGLRAQGGGAAIWPPSPRVVWRNVLVAGNTATGRGSGIDAVGGTNEMRNVTVAGNTGDGVHRTSGLVEVRDSILWGNGVDATGAMAIAWSDVGVMDATIGTNNCISVDPLFVDTTYYHLQSRAGNYVGGYFDGGSWAASPVDSPCIDAGDLASDYAREPAPNGKRVNMGAYGNTAVASRTRLVGRGSVILVR